MKRLATFLMLMVLLCFVVGANVYHNPQQESIMLSTVMNSVVEVWFDGIPIPASGFYIGDGKIVTAGHVAVMEPQTVRFADGETFEVIDIVVNQNVDCGILYIEPSSKPALLPDEDGLILGEPLFSIGNPRGLNFVCGKGIYSGSADLNEFFGSTTLVVYTIPLAPGSSGSPIVDAEGEVVAVHVGGNGTGYNVGVPVEVILETLGLERCNGSSM